MIPRLVKGIFLASILLLWVNGVSAEEIESIQLVGNFEGITCEPDDPANNMDSIDTHIWRKLKFINEPEDPDTIFFKFTMNGSYLPKHWGWSGIWGEALYDWNPPNIATVLPDSGYHYFNFNDSSYSYWIHRPDGVINGELNLDNRGGAPAGASVTLFDSLYETIGTYTDFIDSTFCFEHLPPATYQLTASAPGYNDTTINDIELENSEPEWISIQLRKITAVMIASASFQHADGGIILMWRTSCYGGSTGFDIYRGWGPELKSMEKRNNLPVCSNCNYRYFDPCSDPSTNLYYFIVETGDDNPTHYGPIHIKGITPQIRNALGRNYPNPFNPITTLPYTIGAEGENKPVNIAFYDVAGRLVDRIDLGSKAVGNYTFTWNPSRSRQGSIPSGVYYCRLQIGKETFTRKLILLR